jgi:hypothetical protein|tara:strand:+ start:872 stop:1255 length:384 start_codon:yes stop_codon:yes gene_type:complete
MGQLQNSREVFPGKGREIKDVSVCPGAQLNVSSPGLIVDPQCSAAQRTSAESFCELRGAISASAFADTSAGLEVPAQRQIFALTDPDPGGGDQSRMGQLDRAGCKPEITVTADRQGITTAIDPEPSG